MMSSALRSARAIVRRRACCLARGRMKRYRFATGVIVPNGEIATGTDCGAIPLAIGGSGWAMCDGHGQARAADRARRRLARSGGVCYTSNRCAAMGSRTPATKQVNGTIKTFSRPVNGLPRPVVCSTRLQGGIFCKWR